MKFFPPKTLMSKNPGHYISQYKFHQFFSKATPLKTNMAMENHHFLIGDTSFNWLVFQPVMLLFRGDSGRDLSVANKNTRRICLSFLMSRMSKNFLSDVKEKTWNKSHSIPLCV